MAVGMLGACLLWAPAAGAVRPVSFLSARQAPYGLQASSLDAADFNRDGYTDLVVLNGSLVEMLLSDGHGRFSPPLLHARGGSYGVQLVARDFSGDGNPDVAVVYGDGNLAIFLGDGHGGIGAAQQFPTGGSPTALCATDLDGDGNLDMVVALAGGSVTGRVQWMRNDGHAQFAATGPAVPAGLLPLRITSGDFDGDGHPDIAVTNGNVCTATVLFGDGQGGLSAPLTLTPVSPTDPAICPYALVAGDVDGDGIDDLIVDNGIIPPTCPIGGCCPGCTALFSGGGATATVSPPPEPDFGIFLHLTGATAVVTDPDDPLPKDLGSAALYRGTRTRSFSAPTSLLTANASEDLRLFDLDGDGRLDVISVGLGFVWLLAQPDGSFVRHSSWPAGPDAFVAAALGDFNADGRPDVAMADGTPRVTVDFGLGGGRFAKRYFLQPNPPAFQISAVAVQTADLNNDGIADLVTTTAGGGTIETWLGRGAGDFEPPRSSSISGSQVTWFALADFTGDGLVDVVVAVGPQLMLLRGDGHGGFADPSLVSSDRAAWGAFVAADLNGDASPDLIVPTVGGAYILLNDGMGHFRHSTTLVEPVTRAVLVGDLNRDGKLDVLLDTGDVFLGNGDGTFAAAPITNPAATFAWPNMALVDIDEDGILDLVESHGNTGLGTYWLRGGGQGRFGDPVPVTLDYTTPGTAATTVGSVAVADFNGDGHADIAVSAVSGVSIFLGDGHGGFSSPAFVFAFNGSPLLVADLNGDGLPDLAGPAPDFVNAPISAWVTLLFNNTPPDPIVPGDANCDGRVSATDLAALVHRLYSPFYLPACQGADADGDGEITVRDLLALLDRLLW